LAQWSFEELKGEYLTRNFSAGGFGGGPKRLGGVRLRVNICCQNVKGLGRRVLIGTWKQVLSPGRVPQSIESMTVVAPPILRLNNGRLREPSWPSLGDKGPTTVRDAGDENHRISTLEN
jgi:hypothetical protein